MIELIVAIVLMGVAAAYIFSNYNDLDASTDTQNAKRNLLNLRIATADVFRADGDYSSLTTARAISLSIFPSNMVKGSTIVNSFGGTVTLAVNGSNSLHFDVTYTEVPGEACGSMATIADGWESVTVNGTSIPQTGSGAAQAAAGACVDGNNTIVYTAR